MVTSIQFGSKKINFRVEYSARKTLGITVTPDLDVLVKVKQNVTEIVAARMKVFGSVNKAQRY